MTLHVKKFAFAIPKDYCFCRSYLLTARAPPDYN
jgi:hypothetical protein